MSYAKDLADRIERQIQIDLQGHSIELLKADGLYRHWRCSNNGSFNLRFDIVTWPGSLCYTGDMGDYLFQRTNDMLEFVRRSCMSFGYMAEKCVASDGRVSEWREEVYRETLAEMLEDSRSNTECGDIDPEYDAKVRECLDTLGGEDYSQEIISMEALYQSGLVDGCDMPSCKAFTYHFVWAMYALRWFCERVPAK